MERGEDKRPANNPDERESASRSVGDGPEIKGGVVFEVETKADAGQARFFGNPDDDQLSDAAGDRGQPDAWTDSRPTTAIDEDLLDVNPETGADEDAASIMTSSGGVGRLRDDDPEARRRPTDDGTLAETSNHLEFGKGAGADHGHSEQAAAELGGGLGAMSDGPESVRETYPQRLDEAQSEGGQGHIFIDTGEGGIDQINAGDDSTVTTEDGEAAQMKSLLSFRSMSDKSVNFGVGATDVKVEGEAVATTFGRTVSDGSNSTGATSSDSRDSRSSEEDTDDTGATEDNDDTDSPSTESLTSIDNDPLDLDRELDSRIEDDSPSEAVEPDTMDMGFD